jgi:hypothetical protein
MTTAEFHNLMQANIGRMSQLGLSVRTLGLGFFGAGSTFYFATIIKLEKQEIHYFYLIGLLYLCLSFVYMDAQYLRRERLFIHLDSEIISHKRLIGEIKMSNLSIHLSDYEDTRMSNCLKSFAIRPVWFMEISVVIILIVFTCFWL